MMENCLVMIRATSNDKKSHKWAKSCREGEVESGMLRANKLNIFLSTK
jgi:hypothetical protein